MESARNFAPTASLPPLGRLLWTHPTNVVKHGLNNLEKIYFPPNVAKSTLSNLDDPFIAVPQRPVPCSLHDTSAPDSGYASAEEDQVPLKPSTPPPSTDVEEEDTSDLEVLRSDPFERSFALKWLTTFVQQAGEWVEAAGEDEEWEERNTLLEQAIRFISRFNGVDDDQEEEADITRPFAFPCPIQGRKAIAAELNDAPLLSEDHTSVGLQSWGSSILFSEKICADPVRFSLGPWTSGGAPKRILELGAGTGLLSIVVAKIYEAYADEPFPTVITTDYHPDVLRNLTANVETNFPHNDTQSRIEVHCLDWSEPSTSAPFDEPFDVILAADVVYDPLHASWIRSCVERMLKPDGVFWMIIAIRNSGRHEGLDQTVDEVFPMDGHGLCTLSREDLRKQDGVGRADEGGYRLFKIGWSDNI